MDKIELMKWFPFCIIVMLLLFLGLLVNLIIFINKIEKRPKQDSDRGYLINKFTSI